ncbi:hypothetical protein ACOSQ4_023947 [Xanthoceras sorbifolium]
MVEKQYWSGMEAEAVVLLLIVVCMNGLVVLSAQQQQLFPAMFVFGDSLTDSGNNNYLISLAKANYVPYGIDFYQGRPTGRFSNGKTIIDFLGDLIGLPLLPTFEETLVGVEDVSGVNYASAAAGILDETGLNLGQRFSLRQQVENFKSTLRQLKEQMDEVIMKEYLAKSLIVMNLGSNDYINNYLIHSFYSNTSYYNPNEYALFLITQYTTYIMELHNLGARKFLLAAIGPLGCLPNQLAAGYAAFIDMLNNPDSYGFRVTDRGCCGIGRNQGQITCLPFSIPCLNRDQYIFWDAYHPTQAFNQIIAQKAYNGGLSVCYPMNVKQMARV